MGKAKGSIGAKFLLIAIILVGTGAAVNAAIDGNFDTSTDSTATDSGTTDSSVTSDTGTDAVPADGNFDVPSPGDEIVVPSINPSEILLKSRHFIPEPGINQTFEAELLASEEASVHVLLQLYHAPTDAERRLLEENNVRLLAYLPHNAWFAYILPKDVTSVVALPAVRWVGRILPEDKIDLRIQKYGVGSWAVNEDGTVNLVVVFFGGIPREKVQDTVNRYGITVWGPGMLNDWTVTMSEGDIGALAAEDVVQWIEDAYPPETTYNDESRVVIGADFVQVPPYNLDGTNIQVGIWDSGNISEDHEDLQGRVTNLDTYPENNHTQHVAGTVGGDGNLSDGKYSGMATNVTFFSYSFQSGNDEPEEHDPAINTYGIDLSQNSWGLVLKPADNNCDWHGDYQTRSAKYDNITRGYYGDRIPIIFGAGNDGSGNKGCPPGYNTTIPVGATAKNTITVGATNSNDDSIAEFSSLGPTDDGRIKPDVMAPGSQVGGDNGITSTLLDDTYGPMQGTSMATPAVSGSVALMLQDYRATHDNSDPLPSTVKAILMHTAEDLNNTGPDFSTGYGRIDVLAAINLIEADNDSQQRIVEAEIDDLETDTYNISVPSGMPELKVTLVWDDYPGTPNGGKMLVNDLNLVVTAPDETVYYPWVLNLSDLDEPAKTGIDAVNNVEQVVITSPTSGTYNITVNGSDIPNGPQNYSLILPDVILPTVTITSPSGATNATPELNFTVDERVHAVYSWDSEGNISGCMNCESYNTTYGESVPDVNTSILLHFNENHGTGAYDDSANGNDGILGDTTVSTLPDWVTGQFGYALDFDGIDDFVKVADDDSIDFDNDSNYSFTMMFWVKTGDSAFSEETQYIFDKSSSGGSYNGYHMYINSSDSYKLRFMYHQGAQNTLDMFSTGPIHDGEWHHIAAVRNLTGKEGYLYIDGVLNSSATDNTENPGNNSGDLYIGANGPTWNNFNGTIDDFHIIARALNETEIEDIYNKTLPEGSHTVTVYANDTAGNLNSTASSFTVGAAPLEITIDSPANDTIIDTTPDLNFTVSELANTTYNWNGEGNISGCGNCTSFNTTYGENNGSDANLTALWHMNENTGTTAYDDASNNNGTLGNATAGTQPAWTTGKFGHALEFDGTSDFVNVSDSQDLDMNGPFTLTAWIYSTNSTDNQAIIFKIDKFPAWHGYHFNLMKGANSMKLRCMSHNKSGASDSGDIISDDNLTINEWHFVACVRDTSTGNLSLYFDGAEAAAPATDNSTNKDITNDVPLFIGTNGWGAAYFNGTIDEVAIYDRALSAAEIQGLYSKALLIGQHNVTVYAVDNASNSNSETRWFTVSSIDITSPPNTTISDTTPNLNFTVSETANTTYNWDGEGNISGCMNCDSYNTTYGENNGSGSDLVGLWHLNENFGTMVYGDSPYGNDGDVINTPAWSADCRFGACLDFQSNGQDQVNISGSSLDSIAQEITVSFWFYLDSDDYPSENFAFLKKGNEAGTPMSWGAWYKGASDDLIRVRIDNSTSKVVLDTAAPTNAKEWYHLAFTYNGSEVRIYLNGELNVSTPHSGNIADTAGYPLAIGRWGNAYYDGKLDEIMIFNRSLDASEIHDLYGRTLPAGQHSVTVWATDSEGDQDSAIRYFTIG